MSCCAGHDLEDLKDLEHISTQTPHTRQRVKTLAVVHVDGRRLEVRAELPVGCDQKAFGDRINFVYVR